jgi:hypothetical protein
MFKPLADRLEKVTRNFTLCGKQYRTSFVVKSQYDNRTEEWHKTDCWLVIEAPPRIKDALRAIFQTNMGNVKVF